MAKVLQDNLQYARVILKMGVRENAAATDLSEVLPDDLIHQLRDAAIHSMGVGVCTLPLFVPPIPPEKVAEEIGGEVVTDDCHMPHVLQVMIDRTRSPCRIVVGWWNGHQLACGAPCRRMVWPPGCSTPLGTSRHSCHGIDKDALALVVFLPCDIIFGCAVVPVGMKG